MKRRVPTAWLLDARSPRNRGRIHGLPLNADVRVHTDRWGIPRIQADNESDLFTAQGWVHASGRLWQMESLRRLATGRLAEIAGESMLELDHFARMAGFPEVCRRAVKGMSSESREKIDSYLNGINAFIEKHKTRLPLEFRSAGIKPAPWTPLDATANLVVNSWYLQTNYLEEVLAIRTRDKLSRAQWDALFPGMGAFEGDKPPEDAYFEDLRKLRIGKFIPATYAFYKEFKQICGASNNWISSKGPGGLPLLANDPHLGIQLPQIWFACGLRCPGTDICGVGMPGFPGTVIGRTPEVSWGFTNVMTDIVDLFVIPIDPKKLTCTINGKEHPLTISEERFSLPGGRETRRTLYSCPHGSLMTEIGPGIDAAVALKWYGTLPEGMLDDRSAEGILGFSDVKNVGELQSRSSMLTTIGQNIVAGDTNGDILWQATGSIPLRRGYSGRLPADGGKDHDWTGFVPFDRMPGSANPPEGWIITANHRTVAADAEVMPTRSWAQPWRYRRIREILEDMESVNIANFAVLQNDSVSLRPPHVLPVLLGGPFADPRAAKLARILADWDGDCRADSTACLIFNQLPKQICEVLLRDSLGEDLDLYFTLLPFFTGLIESIAVDPGILSLFPNTDGGIPKLPETVEKSLIAIHAELTAQFGPKTRKWQWGRWNRLYFRHPGSRKGITSWLLNRGPWPVDGDWTTVNVCGSSLLKNPGEATTIPSMRFISSLADRNENILCMPLGQSGRPGNRHYDDFAPLYIRGEYVPFPMDPEKAAKKSRILIMQGS